MATEKIIVSIWEGNLKKKEHGIHQDKSISHEERAFLTTFFSAEIIQRKRERRGEEKESKFFKV